MPNPDPNTTPPAFGHVRSTAELGPLLPCRMCGGKPYAYDMRGSGTHEFCTVECGSCDHDVQAGTPEEAAAKWHSARA